MKINIFKKKKEMESISLTFKMPIINFLNYFKSHHSWSIDFNDEELIEIEKAVKKARKGKPQELFFEDENYIKEVLREK